ncbi:tripartite tricarboxylate transporter TctB family protein [Mesorhizobium xinjiangense]|uniref:tripartite tricarboxylate transporter TctB family protein n=1 Tax=Mesorhizobium xinjiangense TaxID=2678685 RepID=UPI0018DC7E80|nr:tripartite tricarboxylate transporter TctB family protein [Mesorhizobium xinjiangense]
MTVRTAEFTASILLILASLGLMWKSADGLSVGWIPGAGPGSGFWPFWLAVIMLLSSIATLVRWFLRATPQSRSDEAFVDRDTVQIVGLTVLALFFLLLASHYFGMYVSLMAFLLFYLRFIGGHSWTLSITLMVFIPTFVFFFFEYLMTIPLPKGITEPLFYPLYQFLY